MRWSWWATESNRMVFPFPRLVRWIKLKEVTGNLRLAECPDIIDPEDIGMPSYFIRYQNDDELAGLGCDENG